VGKLKKALLHTTLLLVVLIVAVFLYLDRIVGSAIEEGATRALGVRTDVGGVQIALLRGHVGLTGLEIANPDGFSDEQFLRLGRVRVDIPPSALREDTVVIPSIALDDLELALEGSERGTNYGRILANLSQPGAGSAKSEPAPTAESGGKKFIVKELVAHNVKATLAVEGLGSKLANTSITLPEIRLHDLGAHSGGMELSELIGQVTDGVVKSVVRQQPELAGLMGSGLQTGAQKAREELERLGGIFRRD
jgi:hypothetical protein